MSYRSYPREKKKVLVAMSGGVDSSVAAALLVKQGYGLTGAYMKQWDERIQNSEFRIKNFGICPWKADRRDALRVAATLGIPLLTFDFEKEYREQVYQYMIREYKKGRTPNPDVVCNREIKFGVWLSEARKRGYDYLATGHYAKIERMKDFKITLLQAKDKNKDQTYFLHQLNQDQLRHTLFPIGDYTKAEVRQLARRFRLPTAERDESMGICFVGEVPMREFLKNKIKNKIGKIVMSDGTIIGEHDGLPLYTIGQRHGVGEFRIKNLELRIDNRPLFVVGKDAKKNELIVGFEDDPLLWKKKIEVGDLNWVSGQPPEFPLQCKVRLRHRQQMQDVIASIQTTDNRRQIPRSVVRSPLVVVITFATPQKAVTPGQFAVFYTEGECLGGGVIL